LEGQLDLWVVGRGGVEMAEGGEGEGVGVALDEGVGGEDD